LIRSIPRIDADASRGSRLTSIPGTVPSLIEPAPGCRFAPRCAHARAACTQATPVLREVGAGHRVACILEEAPL
jgi:peptide/nickel transport system ATP-binding protein